MKGKYFVLFKVNMDTIYNFIGYILTNYYKKVIELLIKE